MSVVDGLTDEISKWGVVAIAFTTSVDTFMAKRLILVAFDFPYSIAD